MGDVLINSRSQFRHPGEYPAAQVIFRNVAEEALYHVQPRGRSGHEVHVEARILL